MGLPLQTPCIEQSAIGESIIKSAGAFHPQQRVCNLSHTVGTQWQLQRRQDDLMVERQRLSIVPEKDLAPPTWALLSEIPAQSSHCVSSLILEELC